MHFYTNVTKAKDEILCRGYDDQGNQVFTREKFKPKLYTKVSHRTPFKTIRNEPLEERVFDSIKDYRDFLKKYQGITGFEVYGDIQPEYQYLNEKFKDGFSYDLDKLRIFYLDIETDSSLGFPDILNPRSEINAITVEYNKKVVTFGLKPYNVLRGDVTYYHCNSEKHLLKLFLKLWKTIMPDIVSGWYTNFFDLPYIVNRMDKILGYGSSKELSPWKKIFKKEVDFGNRKLPTVVIEGVNSIDYMEVYQKYYHDPVPDMKLDTVCEMELGEKKLDYSKYKTLHEMYEKDHQRYIDYNIHDVQLVRMLNDKKKLIELTIVLAYFARCNYIDKYKQVRYWDIYIYNYLKDQGIIIPPRGDKEAVSFPGAYVKPPVVGQHKWVVSFDLNSLYPHLIMQYNVSPETIIEGSCVGDLTIEDILANEYKNETDYIVAASGYMFRRDKQGFIPRICQMLYDKRVEYKKLMKQEKIAYETTKEEKHLAKIDEYDNFQHAMKISLNSIYGALGNAFFRFFDVRQASSITLSGQLSSKWVMRDVNIYLNKVCDTKGVDYVIAGDTDSIYLVLDNLVEKYFPNGGEEKKIQSFITKVADEKIEKIIEESYEDLAATMKPYENKMVMKREVVAKKGIWTGKKRYLLSVLDNEGVVYSQPKTKIVGIEAIRSSTPMVCRKALSEIFDVMLSGENQEVIDYIRDFKEKFMKLSFIDVAFPKGVGHIQKYLDPVHITAPKTPINSRAAIYYNKYVIENNLTMTHPIIKEGDKIKYCYLKTPNPMQTNAIAIIDDIPEEFETYIDHETQFNKSFLEPVRAITDVLGWHTKKIKRLAI